MKEEAFNMGNSILNEELWDCDKVDEGRRRTEHDRDGLITNEEDWDSSVKARYGGDELWASKALNAGTDIIKPSAGSDELEI